MVFLVQSSNKKCLNVYKPIKHSCMYTIIYYPGPVSRNK